MRQVVLDTETTGLSTADGHRIIEIGCIELIDRQFTGNHFHYYINPGREIEIGALQVHGITNEFLADKPFFKDISEKLFEFINAAELIIHNAEFDIGFLNYEFRLLDKKFKTIINHCSVIDTLILARQKHPGQQNNLDALCKRYHVDNSDRALHGALLDAKLLAQVYLSMTGGQTNLFIEDHMAEVAAVQKPTLAPIQYRPSLPVIRVTPEEQQAHEQRLAAIKKISGQHLWVE